MSSGSGSSIHTNSLSFSPPVSKFEHLLHTSNGSGNLSSLTNGVGSIGSSSTNYHHTHHNLGQNYGSVKAETNSSNYEYVNNCYFGSSFSALTASGSGMHSASDLAGYHHPIQAAKLMASS